MNKIANYLIKKAVKHVVGPGEGRLLQAYHKPWWVAGNSFLSDVALDDIKRTAFDKGIGPEELFQARNPFNNTFSPIAGPRVNKPNKYKNQFDTSFKDYHEKQINDPETDPGSRREYQYMNTYGYGVDHPFHALYRKNKREDILYDRLIDKFFPLFKQK